MTDHPITPPPELVQQWASESLATQNLCNRAAQWGADQELKACCKWTTANFGELPGQNLYLFRRPKPPSLKEQACELLECYGTSGVKLTADQCNTIRRALEALPND
jgi:hypothetical protein